MKLDTKDIIVCDKPDEISYKEINTCLQSAYRIWKEKGVDFGVLSQDAEATEKRIEGGYCLTALYKGELVGTVSYQITDDNGIYFFMLGVDERYKNNGIAKLLLKQLEKIALEKGYKYIIADTSEKADWLLKWYCGKMGFNKYTVFKYQNKDYRSISFKKYLSMFKPVEKVWCLFHYALSILYYYVKH